MSTIYAASVVLECEHRSADGVTDVHTYSVQVPTFYLFSDVQGIVDSGHAESIVVSMFERTENLIMAHVQVCETSADAHASGLARLAGPALDVLDDALELLSGWEPDDDNADYSGARVALETRRDSLVRDYQTSLEL